jgi:hypothetical protein
MARKSLADKIRESGRATQKELENSKKILKNILDPSSKLNDSDNVTDNIADKLSDIDSDNVTNIIADNISDNIIEKPIQDISDTKTSVIRSVTSSVTKSKTPSPQKRKSVTSSVTKKMVGFDKALSFHSVFLSKRQLEVYAALLKYGDSGFITQTHISSTTGIPLPTVRQALRVMKERGVLNYKRYQSEGRKGILFSINTNVKIDQNTDMSVTLSVTNSVTSPTSNISPTKSVTKSVTPLISSSSLFNKNTTTLKDIELVLSSDPELGYWQDLKLKPQQIKKWMEEIQINLEDIVDSLKHCRFDLVDNGLLESKPVRDPLSWVYKRLKQYGYYHAPKGYVSFEDRAIERAKERLKRKQERAKELEAIREAELATERKIAFEKMMSDPESDLYNRCFSKLNKIEKRLKGRGLVTSMRKVFDSLIDEGKVEIA